MDCFSLVEKSRSAECDKFWALKPKNSVIDENCTKLFTDNPLLNQLQCHDFIIVVFEAFNSENEFLANVDFINTENAFTGTYPKGTTKLVYKTYFENFDSHSLEEIEVKENASIFNRIFHFTQVDFFVDGSLNFY
ncbi:hypothetical protein MHBO_002854 [Bonamia ostreae]|uniref:Uncharacterized protein n=1 Tax=Bonamia ostreae TaxID=126728 RepID=A0ABV2AP63_9EUKA